VGPAELLIHSYRESHWAREILTPTGTFGQEQPNVVNYATKGSTSTNQMPVLLARSEPIAAVPLGVHSEGPTSGITVIAQLNFSNCTLRN
jgi:hypothetical protein